MDKDMEQNVDVVETETPQVESDEKQAETLLSLLKEASELSRMSATVNRAYIKAKSIDKAKQSYNEMSQMLDNKVKSAIGSIKENSKLYDEIKSKKAEICEQYASIVDTVAEHYDGKMEELLARKASLESENMELAADNQNLRVDKKQKEQQYKKDEKTQKFSDINAIIAEKKSKAEELARQGDLEGAQAALEEYKQLKESQVRETTSGMIEIATIAQQIKMNSEQFKNNKEEISQIDSEISKLEIEKEQKIDNVCKLQDKELTTVDEKTSVFKKFAMFASNTVTKIFNKGKAINNEVFEPMKKKIELQLPIIEESIGTKMSDIKTKAKESFKDKLNKAMEFGKSVRQGAIDKLKQRNDKKRENISNKNQYLEDRE